MLDDKINSLLWRFDEDVEALVKKLNDDTSGRITIVSIEIGLKSQLKQFHDDCVHVVHKNPYAVIEKVFNDRDALLNGD